MDDSINRRSAIGVLEERLKANGYSNAILVSELNRCIGYLMRLPSADVQPIVRCKDCRYGHRFFDVINGITDSWIECRNPDGLNRDTSEDSFCSCGERKDD